MAHVYGTVTIDESNLAKCQDGLAQLVERKALNLVVMGSSPMVGHELKYSHNPRFLKIGKLMN